MFLVVTKENTSQDIAEETWKLKLWHGHLLASSDAKAEKFDGRSGKKDCKPFTN